MRKPGQFLLLLLAIALTITAIPGNVMAKSKNNMKAQSATSLSNPAIEEDSSMESGQKVTWDCVWFGSYPQTEIVDKAETSGVYGRSWGDDSYYEVNETLYESLKNDSGWDANGDTTINGTKYRRIRSGDAAVVVGYSDDDPCFNWNSSNSYHYFRYEKIKWRILDIDGNSKALLLADQVLDTLEAGLRDNRWEESIFRGWLNSEDDFLGHAFSSEEIKDIEESKLDNSSTGVYSDRYNLETTTDKVFLLASYDLYHSERSASYGFYKDDPEVEDKARKSKGSAYSIAMGSTVYKQGVPWFLRSPGTPDSGFDNMQAVIEISGELNESYYPRYKSEAPGVRPALMLDLSKTDAAEYAGTVCSDGTVDEKDPKKEDEQEPTIITAPTAKNMTYNGSAQELVTPGVASSGKILYGLKKDLDPIDNLWEPMYTPGVPTATDAGIYTVLYKLVNNDNTWESSPEEIKVIINKQPFNAVITAPTAKNLTYNKKAQELVSAGSTAEGTFQYALGSKIEPKEGFSNNIPKRREVGTYYVWYKVVVDNNTLDSVPNSVKASIVNNGDTDGDGFLDDEEINGVDTDSDGKVDLHIEDMGADPYKPDLFLEIDWMDNWRNSSDKMEEAKNRLFSISTEKDAYKPDEKALKMVYDAFERHGINLHIDAGPDSIDYVTGKKWGSKSEGQSVDFYKYYTLKEGNSGWDISQYWDDQIAFNKSKSGKSFLKKRKSVFHHVIYINKVKEIYKNGTKITTRTGFTFGIPSQYTVICKGTFQKGIIEEAGTLMHEFGHQLGLDHGGNDGINYKPNYLSVMNYSFQCGGLPYDLKNTLGLRDSELYEELAKRIDYSNYELPTLDEKALNEKEGIDPNALTIGTGLSSMLKRKNSSGGKIEESTGIIAGNPIDFNGNGTIDNNPVAFEINHDDDNPGYNKMYGCKDWDHLNFFEGLEGRGALEQEDTINSFPDELTIEEALKEKVYGCPGDVSIDSIGPFAVIPDVSGQYLSLDISNAYYEDAYFTVNIKESEITDASTQSFMLRGYDDQLIPQRITIPLKSKLLTGSYEVPISIEYEGRTVREEKIPIEVYKPSTQEIKELKKAIDDGELEEIGIPQDIIEIYKELPVTGLDPDDNADSRIISALKLSGISHNIAAGKTIQLKATVSPSTASNKTLKWTSSNEGVAVVNQKGRVLMQSGSGGKSVTIKAEATDGSGVSATWRITSMRRAVKKIAIKGKKKVRAGKALKLKARIKAGKGANKKLKWVSSNPKYAAVSPKGIVKAKKAGKGKKVRITARATDGSGVKKTVKIRIK